MVRGVQGTEREESVRVLLRWAAAGLVIGGILSAANWYSAALLPWVVGFMLATLAGNLRVVSDATAKLIEGTERAR